MTTSYLILLAGKDPASARIPIAQLGVRYKGAQRVEITREMLAEVKANFYKRDTGEVPIDYDHAIETAAGSGDPVPAAGWIKSIDDSPDGQGILWGTVQWTGRAARMIRAGEYKYVSPVIDPNVRDNKTGKPQGWTLTSAALTNQPVLQGMPALVLGETGQQERGEKKVNDYRAMGYSDQDWDSVQLEITRRANALMASNRQLGYAAAEDAVYRQDPSLVDRNWDAIQAEICRRVKALMLGQGAGRKLDYATALQTVMLDDAGITQRYYAAKNRWLGSGAPGARPINPALGSVDLEMQPLVEQKMTVSEGRMDYAAAWKAVLSERPDLAERRKAAMR